MRYLISAILAIYCNSALAQPDYHAIVDPRSPTATNTYHTIGAALEAAPAAAEKPHVIYIRNGRYHEKITVDKPNITLLGEDRDKTVISHDTYAGQKMPGSEETWGTFRSATLTIRAPDFRAQNLTVENSFNFLANDAPDATEKVRGTQAVALATDNGSDRAAFRNVRLSGYQDTLFARSGRSFFLDSIIEGNVDFIFGAGQAVFKNSDIVTRPRAKEMDTIGYLTAPSTDIGNPYGLVFLNCRLLREAGVPDNSTPLGRPWHPTTDFPDGRYADPNAIGASVFIDSYMDAHITRDGWASMRGTSRDGGKKTVFEPESARFFEYKNHGPGAAINAKRRQISEQQAAEYTLKNIFGDWQPRFTTAE